jgi:hypothetical protein
MPAEDVLFIDTFDHYVQAEQHKKWTLGNHTIVAARTNNGTRIGDLRKAFPDDYSTLVSGVAVKMVLAGDIIQFRRRATGTAGFYGQLRHVGDGRLEWNVSGPGISATSSSPWAYVFHASTWYYLEAKISFTVVGDSVAANCEMRVNEQSIGTKSVGGMSLAAGMVAAVNEIDHGGGGGAGTSDIDDVCMTEATFPGDLQYGIIRPNAEGALLEWTAQGAGDHYVEVDDTTPDDDTTYLEAGSSPLSDLWEMEDIAAGTVIHACQGVHYARKTDAGTGIFRFLWRTNSTTYEDTTDQYPSASDYWFHLNVQSVNPVTAVQWTLAEINAVQLGIKRTA